MKRHASLRWLEKTLFIAGLLLIGLWFRNEALARASAETKKPVAVRLPEESSRAPADGASKGPWCPATLEKGVFGRIEIPRLGISALIAEGDGPAQLERAVGHISTSLFPGQPGNCALAGHRDSFLPGLEDVRENDVIRIDTLQDTYTYVVEWGRVVRPGGVDVLDSTIAPSLTLIISDPLHAGGTPREHFVVRARLVEPTAWVAH